MVSHEPSKPRRVELILRQIDTLPTLPALATRLLSLTAADNSSAEQVTQLIRSDPSLTARVLSLCRAADRGVRGDVLTIDRAVVLLGFSAIRNAVLSVNIFDVFGGVVDSDMDPPAQGTGNRPQGSGKTRDSGSILPVPDPPPSIPGLDRKGFWLHSLAVAIAAESIAKAHKAPDLNADEAFVCGLLHDIGKLALDHVLPRSFGRVVEMADLSRGDIAGCERKVIGLDHHTAGKRLAEQWRLPTLLQDCIWLHGSPIDTLPRLDHRRMIGLVKLADALVRQRHIGYSGNHASADIAALTTKLGLSPQEVERATADLFEQLEARGRALGVHDEPSHELAMDSIQRANAALGRANAALERRSRAAALQSRVLEAVSAFNAASTPGRSVQDVLDAAAASAHGLMGDGFYAMLCPVRESAAASPGAAPPADDYWMIAHYDDQGRPAEARYIAAPPHTPDIATIDASRSLGMELMGVLPWIADELMQAADLRTVRMLPLPCGWGTVALLLHAPPGSAASALETSGGWSVLGPLASTWGSAIAAAAQHAGARRLSEELATANAALDAAQQKLTHAESLARLGEMAAGAAHEMNNPLAVICGRSQLLSMILPPGSDQHKSAQLIFRESHRLSDLISCLRMFADPPRAERRTVDLDALLRGVVNRVRKAASKRQGGYGIELQPAEGLPEVWIDADQIDRAVTELLFNAVQAEPKSAVLVNVRVDPESGDLPPTLRIQVTDDGDGMDDHTLKHALDPFFSVKPAGRRVGMGLPRAQQLAQAHGGGVQLRSTPGRGTVATLLIPLDSASSLPDVAAGAIHASSHAA